MCEGASSGLLSDPEDLVADHSAQTRSSVKNLRVIIKEDERPYRPTAFKIAKLVNDEEKPTNVKVSF